MTAGRKKIRVLIVDDSAAVRETLRSIVDKHPQLEVMATAGDPFQAAERIKKEVPDVITLDVEMPRMDGISFLKRLMSQRPIPVVVCSSLVGKGTKTLMAAMEAGAVEIVEKPQVGTKKFLEESTIRIHDKILAAARTQPGRRREVEQVERVSADAILPPSNKRAMHETTQKILAIGASTGGTEALREILMALPPYAPPIAIVQHMPEQFTSAFADRLNGECQITVREARDGERMLNGQALIAPGSHHLVLARSGANYSVKTVEGPLVSRHRPSADVLFRSVARYAGSNALGVILTGMGDDGARGLKEMREAGARTIGQDERTCLVYGMSQAAKRMGAVEQELPLDRIAKAIVTICAERVR